jgi:hypothetical protein
MRFWKFISVPAVAGLFYIGHGLHSGAMPWERVAEGAAVHPQYSPWIDGLAPAAVTQSADGKTIYYWAKRLDPKVESPVQRLKIAGSATADRL